MASVGLTTLRLCSGPGCGRAVQDAVKHCDECLNERRLLQPTADATKQHSTAYDELLDRLRKGTRWQRVRDKAIKRCPLCARCPVAISEIVDHIVPAAIAIQQAHDSGRYPYDRYAGYYLLSNLQGLCRPCHYLKTLEDKIHTGPWHSVVDKELAAKTKCYRF